MLIASGVRCGELVTDRPAPQSVAGDLRRNGVGNFRRYAITQP